MHYVGLDIHKAFTYGVIEDATGEVVNRGKFPNTEENFSEFLEMCVPDRTKIVMESTAVWEFIYELLERMGYKVRLANPVKTKAIASAKIKTDAIDAKTLADLLRADMIAESYIPPKEIRLLRERIRSRTSLMRMRTKTILKIRSILNRQGIPLPTKRWCKYSGDWVMGQKIENRGVIGRYLSVLNSIEEEMNPLNQEIEYLAYNKEDAKLIMTVPGIKAQNAMIIISETGDITRFRNSGHFACYAGLVPGLKQSGNNAYTLGLIQHSNKSLKGALVQAAWSAVRTREDNCLKLYYKRLIKKKGRQRAICATARKMATVVFAMLRDKEEFIA